MSGPRFVLAATATGRWFALNTNSIDRVYQRGNGRDASCVAVVGNTEYELDDTVVSVEDFARMSCPVIPASPGQQLVHLFPAPDENDGGGGRPVEVFEDRYFIVGWRVDGRIVHPLVPGLEISTEAFSGRIFALSPDGSVRELIDIGASYGSVEAAKIAVLLFAQHAWDHRRVVNGT
jgi:hypothetical protein